MSSFRGSGLSLAISSEYIIRRVKQNMFSELNEAGKPKTLIAKISIEFNDLAKASVPKTYLSIWGF